MKRWIAVPLFAAMLVASACGSDSGTDDGSSAGSATTDGVDPTGEATSDWQEVVDAAGEEGSVVLYTSQDPADTQKLADAFHEKYPDITLEFFRDSSGPVGARLTAELEAGQPLADVFLTADTLFQNQLGADGHLVDIEDVDAPNLAEWPADHRAATRFSMGINPLVVSYNTTEVDEVPEGGYDALADPKYAGRIGLVDLQAGAPLFMAYDTMGWPALERMAELGPVTLYPTGAPIPQAIAAGEIAWSPFTQAGQVNQLKETGAPIEFFVPSEGPVFGIVWSTALIADSPHPNAARVLLDFLASTEANTIYLGDGKGFSYIEGGVEGEVEIDSERIRTLACDDCSKYDDPSYIDPMRERFQDLFVG